MLIGKHSDLPSTGSDISALVTVGNYCSIGTHVQMHTRYQHACIESPELVSTKQLNGYPQTSSKEKITIGNDVWIGRNAVLLGGITIGDGAIIGAFSVVAKDVPPYAIVVGNPATVKRYRFNSQQIDALLKIQWWNWSDEKVEANLQDLKDVDIFIRKNFS